MIQSISGLIVFIGIAWILSENRRAVSLRTVISGVALQILIAAVLFKVPVFREFFFALNRVIMALEESTIAGTSFVFGYLGGGNLPFDEKFPGASFILAFRALPLVLVISALSSLLFYWKILPIVVRAFSFVLQKTLKLGGAEGLAIAADIFLGMIESPLFVRPYLKQMSRSEIFSMMTCGMGTIAGTVMVLYATILGKVIPDAMGHLLIASIISAPAAVVISKIMIPQQTEPTSGKISSPETYLSSMDAITKGTLQGIELLINIIAMLIVLVAIVHLINSCLGLFPGISGQPLTLQRMMGYVMSPVVWLIGIPWNEAQAAGSLMGVKSVLNELIAYLDMSRLSPGTLSERSRIIMTYTLCGFANPGSLGILIGGWASMVPERRDDIVSLGFRSLISGTLANCMTGAIVGILQ
ncbi:MAG: nucleoside:proton symporter [Desulfobacteraceae bacterium]|nr:nucleoside:proton symporter [Desulfobacteraceae bacterium]